MGWFGQYASAGQVQVSDNVNGAWTRRASTTFSSGSGDIALFYLQNSAAAPSGLTITITASSATYLQGAAGDYSGVATAGAFDQAAVASGNGVAVDSGPTAAVGAGELVFGGIITGGSPERSVLAPPGGQAFTMQAQSSGSVDLEDVLASAAGAQDARATLERNRLVLGRSRVPPGSLSLRACQVTVGTVPMLGDSKARGSKATLPSTGSTRAHAGLIGAPVSVSAG